MTMTSELAVSPKKGEALDPVKMLAVVAQLSEVMTSIGQQPFLVTGTLLGFVRDGGLMEHDYDIDSAYGRPMTLRQRWQRSRTTRTMTSQSWVVASSRSTAMA